MAISAGNGSAGLNAPAVIVAGEIFLDLLLIGVDHWPEPGKEIFAREFRREIGGGTAITACALARLGCPAAVLVAIGTDSSAWITSRLESCGVSTESVIIETTEPTGITVIASRPEDRLFITYPGANRRFAELLQSWVEMCQDTLLHVHFAVPLDFESGRRVIEAIRRRNASVSLDVGWNRSWLLDPRAWEIARQIDIFFPNATEAEALTGQRNPERMLRSFADNGVRRVALKLGAAGAAMVWDGEIFYADPIPVDCVDTTGAGDCFNAGFLQALFTGADPRECLLRANICGALSTEAYGGIAGAPDRNRLEQELRKMSV